MAQRRMFSPMIVDSDAFLDMSPSAQNLYFHLGMRADDDGFVGNPKKILRMIGGNDDDLKLLMAKRFILSFESGVIVIKHWRLNNFIRKDRYKETQYIEEKNNLNVKDNGAYTLDNEQGIPVALAIWKSDNDSGQPNDNQRSTQVRLGKVRLSKERETPPHTSKKYLLEIPEADVSAFREKYEASASQIKRKGEQMHNYCEAKGKVYKNYRAFLENGLDKDFGRRVKQVATPIESKKVFTPEETARIEIKKKEINALFKVPAHT